MQQLKLVINGIINNNTMIMIKQIKYGIIKKMVDFVDVRCLQNASMSQCLTMSSKLTYLPKRLSSKFPFLSHSEALPFSFDH